MEKINDDMRRSICVQGKLNDFDFHMLKFRPQEFNYKMRCMKMVYVMKLPAHLRDLGILLYDPFSYITIAVERPPHEV